MVANDGEFIRRKLGEAKLYMNYVMVTMKMVKYVVIACTFVSLSINYLHFTKNTKFSRQ